MNFLIWKFYAIYNQYCYWRLRNFSPTLIEEIASYMQGSDTTGTKYSTLWNVVSSIKTHKPLILLESGTGLPTIVIAHTLKKLMHSDKHYQPKFINMESVEKWYTFAVKNFPSHYSDALKILKFLNAKVVRGVIDTRVSSCFVLQVLYGTRSLRYFPILRTANFSINRKLFKKMDSDCFSSDIFGRLTVKLTSVAR